MSDQLTTSTRQLSQLLAQGMVTHILASPEDGMVWSIDPFTIRDMKELKLMAILDDGTVAIACPDGLPEFMTDAATAIKGHFVDEQVEPSARSEESHASARVDALLAAITRVEDLSGRLEGTERALSAAVQPDTPEKIPSAVEDRLDEISAMVQALSQPPSAEHDLVIAQRLAALSDTVARLHEGLSTAPSLQHVQEALASLGDRIEGSRPDPVIPDDITAILVRRDTDPGAPDITAMLGRIEDRLDALARMPLPWLEMGPVRQAIARQTTAMATAIRRIETAFADIKTPLVSSNDDTVLFTLHALQDALGQRDLAEHRSNALEGMIEKLSRDLETLTVSMSQQRATPSDPAEFIGVRQQLARHATAHATVMRRLETVVDRLVSRETVTPPEDMPDRTDMMVLAELSAIRSLLEAPHTPRQVRSEAAPVDSGGNVWEPCIAAMETNVRTALAEQVARALQNTATGYSEVAK